MSNGNRASAARGDSSPFRVLWRRRNTVAAFAILGLIAGGAYLLLAERMYTVTARVHVAQPFGRTSPNASPAGSNAKPPLAPGGSGAAPAAELFHATQAQLFKSTAVLALATVKPGTEDLPTFTGVRNRSAFLKERLDVQPGRGDELITLTLRTPHPQDGEKIINAIIESYEKLQKDQKSVHADEVRATLAAEKQRVDDQLAAAIARLTEARARTAGAASNSPADATLDDAGGSGASRRLETLEEALAKAELETIDRKAQFTAAMASFGVDDPAKLDRALPPGPVTDAEIELIRNETAALQRKLADQSRVYLPTHPVIKQANERIAELQLRYLAALRQQLTRAQQREGDVRRSVQEELGRATARQQQAESIRSLQREVERLTGTSDELDRRIKDVSLAVDTGLITVQTVDPPGYRPSDHSPNAATVLPAGCLAGLALGAVVALIRESANPRLATPEGARAALGVPVLGSIPVSSARSIETFGWSVHADATGESAEAFRGVRTSLQYGLTELGNARRVVVTSPEQLDGKSTLASNVAIALAKSGKNVLLIDANLRDPMQHRIFGVSDAVGLVDVLAGGELNERAIRRTTVERLHVMPAGAVPQNPSELLNSSALPDMLEQLGNKYDVVLIDTPAVGVVDDARIVAAACDAGVLVVRAGKTNRRLAAAARDGLLSVGCPVCGVVVNGCRTSGSGAYRGLVDTARKLDPESPARPNSRGEKREHSASDLG